MPQFSARNGGQRLLSSALCCTLYACYSIPPSANPKGRVTAPIFQMGKQRLTEVKVVNLHPLGWQVAELGFKL